LNADEDFIEMPFVTGQSSATTKMSRKAKAELQAPSSDALIRDDGAGCAASSFHHSASSHPGRPVNVTMPYRVLCPLYEDQDLIEHIVEEGDDMGPVNCDRVSSST
jgi:hypothetical protein